MKGAGMIVITGATGYLGGHVLDLLLEGGMPTRELAAAVRNEERAQPIAERGVAVRYADYDEPESLPRAFAGADVLFFVSGSSRDDEQRVREHKAVMAAATSAGVGHVVYTSFVDAHTPSPFPGAGVHETTERLLRQSGLRWTALRNGAYADYVPMSAHTAVERGELVTPNHAGHVSYVCRDDLARAGATVVREPYYHAGKVYVLSGPKAISQADLAEILSRIGGTEIPYKHVSYDEYKSLLGRTMDMPEQAAEAFMSMNRAIEEGRMSYISDDIELLTGVPPMTLEAFLGTTDLAG
jgi:NAD(P)H dehydrogenase (quinone)